MYKIDKGVPFPEKETDAQFPLLEMEIGDSFFVPCESGDTNRIRASVYSSLNRFIMHSSKELSFKTAKAFIMDAEGQRVDGFRVWRRV